MPGSGRPAAIEFLAAVSLAGLAVLAAAPTASAGHDSFFRSGELVAGHPATAYAGGLAELVHPCDPDARFNGLDGHWYNVRGFDAHGFRLDVADTLDADLYFYDEDCRLLEYGGGTENSIGEAETGVVPSTTRYTIVDGFAGTGAYELRIN